mmetsp:Transcript_17856/g.32386  ORF Transcript_17856/g.32386 Transcript_17856/m.32386 type:complete len:88 (-) Transcript_17856:44-307(-)
MIGTMYRRPSSATRRQNSNGQLQQPELRRSITDPVPNELLAHDILTRAKNDDRDDVSETFFRNSTPKLERPASAARTSQKYHRPSAK